MNEQLSLIPDERASYRLESVSLECFPLLIAGPAPDTSFLKSVERFGVLQPVALIDSLGKGYSIAAGRRRIQAARLVGLESIPAIIFPLGWTVTEVLAIVENAQRSENPASDLRAIRMLVSQGASHDEICVATGLPKSTLDKRLRLVNLREELLLAYEQGLIKTSVAETSAKLSQAKQQQLVDILQEKGKLKYKDVEAVTRTSAADAVSMLPDMLFSTPGNDAPADSEVDPVVARSQAQFAQGFALIESAFQTLPEDAPELQEFLDWRQSLAALVGLATATVPSSEKKVHKALQSLAKAAALKIQQ